MINVFLYSIAGKKSNDKIDEQLSKLTDGDFLPPMDKKILEHTIQVSKNGNYPSVDYYKLFLPIPEFTYKSLAEIATYCDSCIDNYKIQSLQRNFISSLNEAANYSDLRDRLSKSFEDDSRASDYDLADYEPFTYNDAVEKPLYKGMEIGVPEVDAITAGIQPATIATFAAFVGHGKSTMLVSAIFKNVMAGKKGVFLSLEMAPQLLWQQFQARWLYEVKGLQVTFQDLRLRKLPSDVEEKVKEYDSEFRDLFKSNLLILDESAINKKNYARL